MPDNNYGRDASQRLYFAMFRVPANDYQKVCEVLRRHFTLVPHASPIVGVSEVFQDYGRENQIVGLEWDNWMGFTVVAKNPEAEPLVREIGTFLERSVWAGIGQKP
jgi:hypothetical protein